MEISRSTCRPCTIKREFPSVVKDSGIGIPQDKPMPAIFSTAFQKQGAQVSAARHLLAWALRKNIGRQIIKKNTNGEIEVDSSEKQGTTFTITLPQVRSTAHVTNMVSTPAPVEQDLGLGY